MSRPPDGGSIVKCVDDDNTPTHLVCLLNSTVVTPYYNIRIYMILPALMYPCGGAYIRMYICMFARLS